MIAGQLLMILSSFRAFVRVHVLPLVRRAVFDASYPPPRRVTVSLPLAHEGTLMEEIVSALLGAFRGGARTLLVYGPEGDAGSLTVDEAEPLSLTYPSLLRYLSVMAGLHTHHPLNAFVLDTAASELLQCADDTTAVDDYVSRHLRRTGWLHDFEAVTSADVLWATAWLRCHGTATEEEAEQTVIREWTRRVLSSGDSD